MKKHATNRKTDSKLLESIKQKHTSKQHKNTSSIVKTVNTIMLDTV